MTVQPDSATQRQVGHWMAAWAAMLFALVLIGGATRLTESGLSITEWKPVSGVLPPLSESAWREEFAKYQRIPQYSLMNSGMQLAAFKSIFLWEFVHRLWARLVGVVFALPLLWFLARGAVAPNIRPRLFVLLALLAGEGFMGWYMVKSGLTVRVEVSQYRLAAHLAIALVIYGGTVWTAADIFEPRERSALAGPAGIRRLLLSLVLLVFVTAISGAFVAGLRAGKIYNTFPMMGDGWVPAEYAQLSPAWINLFDNPSAAQFNHRLLAAVICALAASAWWWTRRVRKGGPLALRMHFVLGAVLLQVSLGVATLLLSVPVALGVCHQAGALILFTALILALHTASCGAAAPRV